MDIKQCQKKEVFIFLEKKIFNLHNSVTSLYTEVNKEKTPHRYTWKLKKSIVSHRVRTHWNDCFLSCMRDPGVTKGSAK